MAETRQELAWRNKGYQDAMEGRPPHDPASTAWRRASGPEKAAYLAGRRNARNRLQVESQAV